MLILIIVIIIIMMTTVMVSINQMETPIFVFESLSYALNSRLNATCFCLIYSFCTSLYMLYSRELSRPGIK